MNAPANTSPTSRFTASALYRRIRANIATVLQGKDEAINLAVACFCAEGHLLVEDRPGTGKTSLARAMAASIGGVSKRVQFTPDLLPSDITGVSIYSPQSSEFRFRPGPVFTNVLVADEINRASPKTQAALLEVMEERQVTVDGVSRPVPSPFMVVATQNPTDFEGTYVLPEVQLDRFAMRISLGYTDLATEIQVLREREGADPVGELSPAVEPEEFAALMGRARTVPVAPELVEYVGRLVVETREHPDLRLGVSTRGSLTLLAVARAYAIGAGRSFVTPDDVRTLVRPVLVHRMAVTPEAELDGITPAAVLDEILARVPVPRIRRDERARDANGDEPEPGPES